LLICSGAWFVVAWRDATDYKNGDRTNAFVIDSSNSIDE